jgi:hypothetical protein
MSQSRDKKEGNIRMELQGGGKGNISHCLPQSISLPIINKLKTHCEYY